MSQRFAAILMAWVALLAPTPGSAQDTPRPRGDSLIPDERLFVRSDLYLLAGFVGATVAMLPLDGGLARSIRREHLVANETLAAVEDVLNVVGGPAPLVFGGALYLFGRVTDRPGMAHVALHMTEAVVVGLAASGTLKMLAGRARPYASADTSPHDFGFARGFEGERYQAFPSGHATVSFSVAAALLAESAGWSPRARSILASVLFGSATVVGLSRMYADRHWASDVVMGGAIGTFAGLKTVRFNHTRTGNRIDRWLLGESATALRFLPGVMGQGATRIGVVVTY